MKFISKAMSTRGRPRNPPRTTLKEVVVPPASFDLSSQSGRRVASSSPSSETIESELSSLSDQSSDYQTPETSAIMTPAESMTRRDPSSKVFNTMTEGYDDASTTKMAVSIKRKRAHVDDDALLAQTLQEEEYQMDGFGEAIIKRPRMTNSKRSLDLPSLSNRIEALLPKQERRTHSKQLRARRARQNDRKALEPDDARNIIDIESDDSELSEYEAREELDNPVETDDSSISEDSSSAFDEPLASVNSRSRSLQRGRGAGRTMPQNGGMRQHRQQRQQRQQRRGALIPTPDYGESQSWRNRRLSRVS